MALSSGSRLLGSILLRPSVSSIRSRRLIHVSQSAWQIEESSNRSKLAEASSSTSSSGSEQTIETTATTTTTTTTTPPRYPREEENISFTTPGSSRYAEQDKKPIPYLSAPLGIREKPISRKLSFSERRDRAFDYDRRMAKRKAIVKEATRGYFSDFHAMRSHGGKTWRAPSTLIKQDRSLYFPTIRGTCLSNGTERNTAEMLQGKVSVVCIMTSTLSEQHAKSFYEAALEVYKKDRNFQLVQINLQENRLKAYVVSLFTSSLRKTIPTNLQSTYLLSHQDLTMEREEMALHNKHVGYTYLVGPDMKIRWGACAFAEKEERQALIACAGVLLGRLSEEKKGRTA